MHTESSMELEYGNYNYTREIISPVKKLNNRKN